MPYRDYSHLDFEFPEPGILRIVFNTPGRLNAVSADQHRELARVWNDIDRDPNVSVVIVTGADGGVFLDRLVLTTDTSCDPGDPAAPCPVPTTTNTTTTRPREPAATTTTVSTRPRRPRRPTPSRPDKPRPRARATV